MSDPVDIVHDVIALIKRNEGAGQFGSFSGTVYDAAWLSMISKQHHAHKELLFPECFDYVLRSQQEDGAWVSNTSRVDGILNSLASLLSLLTRQRSIGKDSIEASMLRRHTDRAYLAVERLLQHWDVKSTVHVGFEILVPGLLRQLESFEIHFEFSGHPALVQLHDQKLKRFDPKIVYSTKSTTLLHSLEAFVGSIDFAKVSHHCSEALGILGSPAATAAYLINSTNWDDRAEAYLKTVFEAYGKTGAVPSAYPTSMFELSWTISTLLTPEVVSCQLPEHEKQELAQFWLKCLDRQGGVVGFAPGILIDADDTARALMTLQQLGKPMNPDRLIESFEAENCFRTYTLEGSPSLSANCHVLMSILGCSDLISYETQIQKAIVYLLEAEESGSLSDKWNLSPQYSRMLLMQAFQLIMQRHNSGSLERLPASITDDRIPSSICRLLSQTILAQNINGSWDDSQEVTAYSVLTIVHCLSLPWSDAIKRQVNQHVSRGREYLLNGHSEKVEYLWIEKVSYRSSLLHSTYHSAALNIRTAEYQWSSGIRDIFFLAPDITRRTTKLFSSLPLFHDSRLSTVDDLFLVEANILSRRLKSCRDELFTRDDIPMTADKYLEFIPAIWVACNHNSQYSLSAKVVWEMILLSLYNFQVDEYMESVVVKLSASELKTLTTLLRQACEVRSETTTKAVSPAADERESSTLKAEKSLNGIKAKDPFPVDQVGSEVVAKAFQTLFRFIQHVIDHWSVLRSPSSQRHEVAEQILKFLQAHIRHNQDNLLLAGQRTQTVSFGTTQQAFKTKTNYYDWIHSVASIDTSCPYSFLFFAGLIDDRGRNCFDGARATYLSKSLSTHLAAMCRQYNDYGSAKRDAEECNLNSLDFPDFRSEEETNDGPVPLSSAKSANGGQSETGRQARKKHTIPPETRLNGKKRKLRSSGGTEDGGAEAVVVEDHITNPSSPSQPLSYPTPSSSAKSNLLAIAEFERESMLLALEKLKGILADETVRKLQVFIDVTDAFGQIYVQQDIASRVKN